MGHDLSQGDLDHKHGWERVILDGQELLDVAKWIANHHCRAFFLRPMSITIAQSGKSGIGTNTVIRCACGAGSDITDYESW
jgi:hypothetical protein